MPLDILFINPTAAEVIYQDLGKTFSAIEPPIWAGMLANHCLHRKFAAEILDTDALHLTDDQAVERIKQQDPRLVAFVIYGQHPSASTQSMVGAVRLAEKLRARYPSYKILFVGAHVAALPRETLERHACVDFVCQNEGVYTISALLKTNLKDGLKGIKGLGFRQGEEIILNQSSPIVAQEDLERDLPGVAWNLLPMDRYRTALWHALPNACQRQPFASLYTSLGCPMRCSFCMINIINRQDNEYADGSAVFRYWRPEFMIEEFDKLARMGIRNIKIADELFVYRKEHFLRLCQLIIERGYDFNIWCYARVDMTRPEYLDILKKAGVNFLALGIESGNLRV
ncbi:MAG TPA: cobalamin-dependent protein, partial [Candidatus Bathyarchaeia archaeon]|nr:cobalamin-dependent protein [Candidatus Bathyarchaeia archaeon]